MDYQLRDQQTVSVRVQVVDMNSFTLDLRVPTYLPAKDLTQRVARDAGLDAYWPDGKRRLYWLRARGRLLQDNENLGDLAVINGELVYLLPQPPAGSGVLEQPPDYPENRGYAGKGTLALVGSVLGVVLPALVAVVQYQELGSILTLVLALSAVQFVIGNFLDPYVMGSSLNLSPFAILISLALWSELWGIPGAFLAVPITAIVTIVFAGFPGTRQVAVLLSKNGQV